MVGTARTCPVPPRHFLPSLRSRLTRPIDRRQRNAPAASSRVLGPSGRRPLRCPHAAERFAARANHVSTPGALLRRFRSRRVVANAPRRRASPRRRLRRAAVLYRAGRAGSVGRERGSIAGTLKAAPERSVERARCVTGWPPRPPPSLPGIVVGQAFRAPTRIAGSG